MKKSFPKTITIFLLLIFLPSLIYSLYLYHTGKNFYKIAQNHYPISVHLLSTENDPVANSIIKYFAEDNFIEQVLKKEFFNDNAGIVFSDIKQMSELSEIQYSYVFYFDYYGDKKNLFYSKDKLLNYIWLKYNNLYSRSVKIIDKQNKKKQEDCLKLLEKFIQNNESIKELINLYVSKCNLLFQLEASENIVSLDYSISSSVKYEDNENFFKSLFDILVIDNFPMQINVQKNYNPSYVIFSIISIISLTLLISFNFALISSFLKRLNK